MRVQALRVKLRFRAIRYCRFINENKVLHTYEFCKVEHLYSCIATNFLIIQNKIKPTQGRFNFLNCKVALF